MKNFFSPFVITLLALCLLAIVSFLMAQPVDLVAIIWVLNTVIWLVSSRIFELKADKYKKLYTDETAKVIKERDSLEKQVTHLTAENEALHECLKVKG